MDASHRDIAVMLLHALSALLPVFLAGVLFALLAASLHHKLHDWRRFTAIMAEYRLLPQRLLFPAFAVLVAAEAAVLLGLPFARLRACALALGAALLAVYAAAIAVNLLRGRTGISCGCGMDEEPISWRMVVRNAVLAAAFLGSMAIKADANLPMPGTAVAFGLGLVAATVAAAIALLSRNWIDLRPGIRKGAA